MHALHRSQVPRAMMLTVTGAFLAIVLILALATKLGDLASTSAPTGMAAAPTPAHAASAGHEWDMSPFAPLLSAPPAVPWARTRP